MDSNINICYTLVHSAKTPFTDWTFLSASLVRRLYPSNPIVLCTDSGTHSLLQQQRHSLLGVVDRVIPFRETDIQLRRQSRRIKTSLRNLVDGDLIFLDGDTLPVDRFDELADHDADFAAVADPTRLDQIEQWYKPACATLDWAYPSGKYLNSGVYFIRDNDAGRRLGQMWHERWKIWSEFDNSRLHSDQPSLNAALTDLQTQVVELAPSLNAMVRSPKSVMDGARILHFFASYGAMPRSSLLHHLREHHRKHGVIDWRAVENARKTSNPWVWPLPFVHAELAVSDAIRFIRTKVRGHLPRAWRPLLAR